MSDQSHPGPLGEEAARLAAALRDWAGGRTCEDPSADGVPCRFCPLCRLVARMQALRPEVLVHLAEAAGALAAALQELAAERPPASRPEPPETDGDRAAAREPASGVQHIDIG